MLLSLESRKILWIPRLWIPYIHGRRWSFRRLPRPSEGFRRLPKASGGFGFRRLRKASEGFGRQSLRKPSEGFGTNVFEIPFCAPAAENNMCRATRCASRRGCRPCIHTRRVAARPPHGAIANSTKDTITPRGLATGVTLTQLIGNEWTECNQATSIEHERARRNTGNGQLLPRPMITAQRTCERRATAPWA